MSKRKILLLLGCGIFFTSLYGVENEMGQKKHSSRLLTTIQSKVLETIKHAEEIPGLKSDEFSALKPEISNVWNTLFKEGVLEVSGTDKEVRPYFVTLQGVVEHVLAFELQKDVTALKGAIHTPMPATPLCTKGEVSKELVDSSIENDPARLFTVKARTTIVRDYLSKGGDLYVIYPREGLKKRTEEQQKIYQQELANYPTHLFDLPLNCQEIPTDLVGATYFFKDRFGQTFVFAIKMTQAKDPQSKGHFGLWFGQIDHPAIQKRIQALDHYMKQSGSHVLAKLMKE